jgi:hypothetical protein
LIGQGNPEDIPEAFLFAKAFAQVLWLIIPGTMAIVICIFAYIFVNDSEQHLKRLREDRGESLIEN